MYEMREIILIAHDIRSCHNIGSLLRTAEGLGVRHVYLTGYTPYPQTEHDARLPHLSRKIDKDIRKTALGAENLVAWSQANTIEEVIEPLRHDGYQIIGLEQTDNSLPLPDFRPPEKIAIVLGREVEGIDQSVLKLCDQTIEIPMFGQKESFNVVQAAAMVLYHCKFIG
jgi:23S rRNA (guanosine2251-2'-O)-methyltransferase